MISQSVQPGRLGSQASRGFDEVWEMPNAVVDTKVEIYDRAGEELAGTFDASKLISISTTKQLFSGNEPTVGNAISGELDMEFYPVTDFGEDTTVNGAFSETLSGGVHNDTSVVNGKLVITEG